MANVKAPGRKVSRDRILSDQEIRAFWQACDRMSWPFGPLFQLLLLRVPHLSIAVLGGIQPDKLPKIMGGAEDCFAARFLFAWPEVEPQFRLAREILDESTAKAALARLIELTMNPEGDDLGPQYVM